MLFEDWYPATYPGLVAALAVAGGDLDSAHDAADEAMARAFERWDRVCVMDSPDGWAYTVGLNFVRRRGRRAAIERRLLGRPTTSQPPDHDSDQPIWEFVRALPARQRQAIGLRYLLDLTEKQVAKQMGVAPGTASATLATARSTLARQMGTSNPTTDGDP